MQACDVQGYIDMNYIMGTSLHLQYVALVNIRVCNHRQKFLTSMTYDLKSFIAHNKSITYNFIYSFLNMKQ